MSALCPHTDKQMVNKDFKPDNKVTNSHKQSKGLTALIVSGKTHSHTNKNLCLTHTNALASERYQRTILDKDNNCGK